jgi:hypothetical protein
LSFFIKILARVKKAGMRAETDAQGSAGRTMDSRSWTPL